MPLEKQVSLNQSPTVSAIIVVYNGEKYLSDAIESILDQTYQDFELILVDDGSTDRSAEIAKSYPRIKYIYQENQGAAAARNTGLKNAKGKFITFLDADDLWLPEKLELQIKTFDHKPKLELVTGYVEQFISPEMPAQVKKIYPNLNKSLKGFVAGAIMIRREVFEKTGLFHDSQHLGETVSWFANVLEKNLNIELLQQVLLRRRIHGNNISIVNQSEKGQAIVHILKESLDRRRNAQKDQQENKGGDQSQ